VPRCTCSCVGRRTDAALTMATDNPLERMLHDAWHEPGLRPAVYKRMLDTAVYVPVEPRPGQTLDRPIPAGETLDVIALTRIDGIGVLPLFTTPEHLFAAFPAGARCVLMKVQDLFRTRPDMHFHLNPYSVYGREFSPSDTRSLLATGGIAVTERIWVPYAEETDFKEPDNPPQAILSALRVLFARNFEIRAAYIAQRSQPKPDREQLLVVVDLVEGGSEKRALREAGTVVTELVEFGMPRFAFAVLPRDGSPIARYFEQATPFYTIGLASSIAAALKLPS
jgi:hypothetical protein